MAAPNTSTCDPWASLDDVGAAGDEFDSEQLVDALQLASDVLYNFTGRQWPGLCTMDDYRPNCYREAGSCGCQSSSTCGCGGRGEVKLPGPVIDVTQVRIDGVVIDPSRYRVDAYRWLVYLPQDGDERQAWPCCQRRDVPPTADDTFSIDYVYGGPPPAGGTRSAASLGLELVKSMAPDEDDHCRLPERVTAITRQGISLAVIDPLTLFADGLTGLPEVDLWTSSILVGAKRRRASVWRPDKGHSAIRRPGT